MRQQEGWLLQVIVVNANGTKHERLLGAASCAEAAEAASVVLATSLGAAESPTLVPTPAPNPNPVAAPAPDPSLGPVTTTANVAPGPAVPPSSAAPSTTTPLSIAPVPVLVGTPAGTAAATPPTVTPNFAVPTDQSHPAGGDASRASVGSVGGRLGLDTSLLGEAAAVVGLVGGVEFQRVGLRAFASATDSVEHAAPGTEGGARIALYAGGLEGCLSLLGVTLRLEGCAGGQVGVLRANGYGVAGTHSDSVFWSAGQGSAVLRWRRGSSGSFWLEAELVVPFRPLYIELANVELHRTPAASAQFWLGFNLDL